MRARIRTFDEAHPVPPIPNFGIYVVRKAGGIRRMASLTEALVHLASDDGLAISISEQLPPSELWDQPDEAVVQIEQFGWPRASVYFRPFAATEHTPEFLDFTNPAVFPSALGTNGYQSEEIGLDRSLLREVQMHGNWK